VPPAMAYLLRVVVQAPTLWSFSATSPFTLDVQHPFICMPHPVVDHIPFLCRLRELFVEEELKGSYGRLIQFVRDTEPIISTPNPDGGWAIMMMMWRGRRRRRRRRRRKRKSTRRRG
jgi:hypothetical protein